MATGSQIIKVQLTTRDIERAESLTDWAAKQPDLSPTGSASRSSVLREAIRRGLASMEREKAREQKAESRAG